MADRQLLGRLGIAAITLAAVVGCLFILGDDGDPVPAGTVAVVGEPSTTTGPPRTIFSTGMFTSTPPAPSGRQVTYELAGSGTATLVYDENGLGLVHQELDVRLPWRRELIWSRTGTPTVQLLGQGSGPLECRIVVDGTTVTTQRAAAGEVATCAGRLG